MLVDNPLLTLLGRRGRGAVIEVMLRNPARTWTVRELARFADVAPMVASRAVRELAALGAVLALRPGRDLRVRWKDGPASAWLWAARVPDLQKQAADLFAATYLRPAGVSAVLHWRHPDDDVADPIAPLRIAVIARNEADALEAAGPALDALHDAGYQSAELSSWTPDAIRADEPVARAIRAGRAL